MNPAPRPGPVPGPAAAEGQQTSRRLGITAARGARSALGLALAMQPALMRPAAAQVTVGYRAPVLSTAFTGLEQRRGVEETVTFAVAGVNVVPADGSLIYDQDTIWRIFEPGRPFSLTVRENSPQLELRRVDITSRSAEVRRTERVFVQVSGPAAEALRSVFPLEAARVVDPTLQLQNLSVFSP